MIPKKIHYCWFGENPLPKEVISCIESWKKFCPEYEIIQWNEDNYDINKNAYLKKSYESKKYAFVTDYARLDVIYNEGGIYLDTDVELIKNLDSLLDNNCYLGMEEVGTINTGLGFGAVKGHSLIRQNKEYYEQNNFIDDNGNFKKIICVKITTDILKEKGLKKINEIQKINDIIIYPTEYFAPLQMGTNKLTITKNTYSIHHYAASWYTGNKWIKKIKYKLIPLKQFIKKHILRSI